MVVEVGMGWGGRYGQMQTEHGRPQRSKQMLLRRRLGPLGAALSSSEEEEEESPSKERKGRASMDG